MREEYLTGSFTACRPMPNGVSPLVCRLKSVLLRKKSGKIGAKTCFLGANNGRHLLKQVILLARRIIMIQGGMSSPPTAMASVTLHLWEVSIQTH